MVRNLHESTPKSMMDPLLNCARALMIVVLTFLASIGTVLVRTVAPLCVVLAIKLLEEKHNVT